MRLSSVFALSILLGSSIAAASPCTQDQLLTLSIASNVHGTGRGFLSLLASAVDAGELSCEYNFHPDTGMRLAVCGNESTSYGEYVFSEGGRPAVTAMMAHTDVSCYGARTELASLRFDPGHPGSVSVQGYLADANGLTLQIHTGGCTSKDQLFMITYDRVTQGKTITYLVPMRLDADNCRGAMIEKFDFSWSELGLSGIDPTLVQVVK